MSLLEKQFIFCCKRANVRKSLVEGSSLRAQPGNEPLVL